MPGRPSLAGQLLGLLWKAHLCDCHAEGQERGLWEGSCNPAAGGGALAVAMAWSGLLSWLSLALY